MYMKVKVVQSWPTLCHCKDNTVYGILQSRILNGSVQFSHLQLFGAPWIAARQASLSVTNSWSLLKLMSIQSVMLSNHLILCRPLLLPPSIFPSIRVFSNESLTRQNFVSKVMSLLFNTLSRLVITFLQRSKHPLISLLQSLSVVILEPRKIKSATVSPSICHEVMGLDVMILVF